MRAVPGLLMILSSIATHRGATAQEAGDGSWYVGPQLGVVALSGDVFTFWAAGPFMSVRGGVRTAHGIGLEADVGLSWHCFNVFSVPGTATTTDATANSTVLGCRDPRNIVHLSLQPTFSLAVAERVALVAGGRAGWMHKGGDAHSGGWELGGTLGAAVHANGQLTIHVDGSFSGVYLNDARVNHAVVERGGWGRQVTLTTALTVRWPSR